MNRQEDPLAEPLLQLMKEVIHHLQAIVAAVLIILLLLPQGAVVHTHPLIREDVPAVALLVEEALPVKVEVDALRVVDADKLKINGR